MEEGKMGGGERTRPTSSTEHISPREFPHASEELSKSTAENSHAYNNVGGEDAAGLEVEQGENEGGGREGEQSTV